VRASARHRAAVSARAAEAESAIRAQSPSDVGEADDR
jgi:hypothetical protein